MAFYSKKKIINLSLWVIFILILGYTKYTFHELWKDEWQAWFVAKDKSLSEIFSFLYYEGHPALWYLYLKVYTLFASLFKAENIINTAHLLTVAGGLFFLFVKFRMPVLLKVLFALSYFVAFEYGLISRGYFLVILFAFWATYLINSKNNGILPGIILFLLCQTEVYGVFIAIALGFYLFINNPTAWATLRKSEFIGLLSGIFIFLVSVFPRSAGHIARTSGKELGFSDNLLTSFQGNLSNTYLIGSTKDTFAYGWTNTGLLLSVLCLISLIYIFRKDRKLLGTVGLFFIMMFSFSVLFFLGGVRQWGMGFIFLIAALELRHPDQVSEKLSSLILVVFGIFNIVHSFKAFREEIRLPFTNAAKTGIFIKEKVPVKVPVLAINKFEATPVVGYAGRKFYELPDGVEFSYFMWVDKIYLPTENEMKLFGKFKGVGGIVVLSPQPLDADRFPSVQLWQKFDTLNYKKENYFIYTLAVK